MNRDREPWCALGEYVEARLDEEETAARRALTADRWRADDGCVYADGEILHRMDDDLDLEMAVAEHVADWDPTRVLADIRTKRRILADFRVLLRTDFADDSVWARLAALGKVVQAMAQVWSERADFWPGWRTDFHW